MAERGPYGPLLPLGRRGPTVALSILVVLAAVGVGTVLLVTGTDCRTDRFGPGSGDGRDPARPLLVHATPALDELPRCADRHLRQVADLAVPNPWTPVGAGASDGAFTGSYDGGGHRLTGLRTFLPGSDDVGLFGVLTGEVRDIVLEDVVVVGRDRVGAVAGDVRPGGRVTDVVVRDARIEGAAAVGELAGRAADPTAVTGRFDGATVARGTGPEVGVDDATSDDD